MNNRSNTFNSVWDALADTAAESARMKARSEMLIAVKSVVSAWRVTQNAAAARLGVTQPRLNDLLQGRVSKFSTDALFDLSTAAGLTATVIVEAAPKRKYSLPISRVYVRSMKKAKPQKIVKRISAPA